MITLLECEFEPDTPENCHLNVKKLPKTWHIFKKIFQKLSFFPQKMPLASDIKTSMKKHNREHLEKHKLSRIQMRFALKV